MSGHQEEDQDEIVTVDELVRLGREASDELRRPITQAELELLHDHLEELRISAALAELWQIGPVTFSVKNGELVAKKYSGAPQ